jgi:hypothetical protein
MCRDQQKRPSLLLGMMASENLAITTLPSSGGPDDRNDDRNEDRHDNADEADDGSAQRADGVRKQQHVEGITPVYAD